MDKEESVTEESSSSYLEKNLKYLRKQNDLTQKELAEALGLSQAAIGNFELGNRNPSLKMCFRLAEYFEITVEQLTRQDLAKEQQYMNAYMNGKRFTPEQGKVYKNKGGGEFLCIQGSNGDAIMRNIASGWTFTAHGALQYENGCIEWDYSTGGHFDCIRKHCRLCEAGFIGGGWMIRTNQRTNDYLCRVVERFQVHSKASKSDNPMVAEMALKMCEVEIWEMWVLTQE